MGVKIPYRKDLEFEYRRCDRLSPLIRRVIAENPSPFSYHGTGTYIVGRGNVAVIDPGPPMPEHIDAILAAVEGETISHILVTHTHIDHSPGCALLKERCGAETYAFGPHGTPRPEPTNESDHMAEGADFDFRPDHTVEHGDVIERDGWTVECVHTPGHTSNHICFALREERTLFTGDHVMGWSTSVIVPPDGNMRAYMESLNLLLEREDKMYWPTHGPSIVEPKPHVEAFIAHRRERESQIYDCISKGTHRIEEMVPLMYQIPEFMYPAAAKSVLAQIYFMVERGDLTTPGDPTPDAEYFLP